MDERGTWRRRELTQGSSPAARVDPVTIPAGFVDIVGDLLIVTKRQQLNYQGTSVLEMLSMDLSSNYLTGKIPEAIISLGGLVNVNLSRNHLNGEVPGKIGAMHSLESLDLSNNNLLREIPSSITMDLSNNNLTGRIPSGGQLDTLHMQNPSMYDGNTGLCGPPLQRNCSSNHTSKLGEEIKGERHHPELCALLSDLASDT
ncbi:hypothetical protein U9M48_004544 [Paspalum notatum var. saurae]|uniref:Uncharacterized protein n=1 Tax=Paspalum notatum var. saurae TaxID=547442 RepID=A0AAQ3PUZ6_PASNO